MTGRGPRVGLATLALATLPAWGVKLPDWAAAIATDAPPLAEGTAEFPWRVLLSETRVVVQVDGKFVLRRRVAQQALRGTTAEIGTSWFHFDDDAKVKTARAWHLPPGEKAQKSWGPPVDVTVDSNFLSDSHARVVGVAGVRAGSLVFFEFEALDTPVGLEILSLFFEGAPVDVMRLEVETPEGWTVRHAWLRASGPEPAVSGPRRVWELRGLEVPVQQPLDRPAADRAPLLVVGLLPPAGLPVGPVTETDWIALASWYEGLSVGRDAVTPDVAEVASSLGATGGGLLERVRTAGGWVRDRVRYVAKEVGVGGYQPRPASQVVRDLYGDCKDKTTLLRSLLRQDGVTSYPILVNATAHETVAVDVPSLASFNHMVLGVAWPAEEAVPEEVQPAMLEAGELGHLLLVDATGEHLAVGALPAALEGQLGLVVAGPRSRLVTLPAGNPRAHRVERHLEVELRGAGGAGLRLVTRYYGQPALEARAAASRSSIDRRAAVERELRGRWPRASVVDYGTEPWAADGAFVESISVELPPTTAGDSDLFGLFSIALQDLPRASLGKRKTDVRFSYPLSLRAETVVRGESDGLRDPQQAAGDGWSVATHYERTEDGALRGLLDVELSRVKFEPEAFEELKRFWSALSRAASSAVSLGGQSRGGA